MRSSSALAPRSRDSDDVRVGERGIAFTWWGGLATVAAQVALLALTSAGAQATELVTVDDPQDDVVLCDTTTGVPTPQVHLDVRYATISGEFVRDLGWDFRVGVGGFGDLGQDVESISNRDPLIAVRFLPEASSQAWIELEYGFLGGQAIQRVVDANGADVPGAGLTVDRGVDGEVLFGATGLPLGSDPRWGAYTRYIVRGHYACDKLESSLSAQGLPLLRLLPTTGATPTPVSTVATAAPTILPTPSGAPTAAATAPPTPIAAASVTPAATAAPSIGPADRIGETGLPWWLILLIGLIGAAAAALLLRRLIGTKGTTNCDDLQRECDRLRRAVEAAVKAQEAAEFELAKWGIKVASLTAADSEDPGTYTSQISVARRQQALAAEEARRAAEVFERAAAAAGEACLAAERCREALQQDDIGA